MSSTQRSDEKATFEKLEQTSALRIPVKLPMNDPDVSGLVRMALNTVIDHHLGEMEAGEVGSGEQDVDPKGPAPLPFSGPDGQAVKAHLDSLLQRLTKHPDSRGLVAESHKQPYLVSLKSLLNFSLDKSEIDKTPDLGDGWPDVMKTPRGLRGVGTKIEQGWQAGEGRMMSDTIGAVVAILSNGQFMLPVKVYLQAGFIRSDGRRAFEAEVVTDHLVGSSVDGSMAEYDPRGDELKVVPHQICFCEVTDVDGEVDMSVRPRPVKIKSTDRFVKTWIGPGEGQWPFKGWIVNTLMEPGTDRIDLRPKTKTVPNPRQAWKVTKFLLCGKW